MSKWTTADIPDQSGRVAVVTGANTGLGFETADALAARGAHVVLAVRNLDKGKDAVGRIDEHPRRQGRAAGARPDARWPRSAPAAERIVADARTRSTC